MKLISSIAFFTILHFTCIAQVKSVDISNKKIGTLNCIYKMSIDLDKGDTTKYIYIGFQNAKYSSIIDTKSIFFGIPNNQDEVLEFTKHLETALGEMGSKSSISWRKDRYSIILYDFSSLMFLGESEKEGSGYTKLNKKNVQKLIDWLKSCEF